MRFLYAFVAVLALVNGVSADPNVLQPPTVAPPQVVSLSGMRKGVHAAPALPPTTPVAPAVDPVPHGLPVAGEGAVCQYKSNFGMCETGACLGGVKVKGQCKGSAAIRCCIPIDSKVEAQLAAFSKDPAVISIRGKAVSAAASPAAPSTPGIRKGADHGPDAVVAKVDTNSFPTPSVVPADNKSGERKTLTGPVFPYSFPYSNKMHLVVDFAKQRMRVYSDATTVVKEYKISSGANGIGYKSGIPGTPGGRFKIYGKIGKGAPKGMAFERLQQTGHIAGPNDRSAYMTTRLLLLDGLDKENANTKSRGIYIHGTNREAKLGNMASHGCFRVSNDAALELFEMIPIGTELFAVPKNAWP